MDIVSLFNKLNDKQREAVVAKDSHVLVLAGAGSGKTRVLTHRVIWLKMIKNYSSSSIMAVTFTNKASLEMKSRINALIGDFSKGMWIGTFHGFAYCLLRSHYLDSNLPKNFQIIDRNDQICLLTKSIRYLGLDEKKWQPNSAVCFISDKKNKSSLFPNVDGRSSKSEITWLNIYKVYQNMCDRAGLVDFDELLCRLYNLLLNNPAILAYYRNKFVNILVDEFQDTNKMQYNCLYLLLGEKSNVMIVGDDDQSIYSWRGAQVDNIYRFISDFSSTRIIRLEQNYRSTNNILQTANTLISYNQNRIAKKLWSTEGKGKTVSLYRAVNELDEAYFVINCIKAWQQKGGLLNNCAILYRSNIQSLVLERVLLHSKIPYKIWGGSIRFFERQEIKNMFAYLRLIINKSDDVAYERILNVPPRGIGKRTLDLVRNISITDQLTLWESTKNLLNNTKLKTRIFRVLQDFITLINFLSEEIEQLSLFDQIDLVIKETGLFCFYKQMQGSKSTLCIESFKEILDAAHRFDQNYENRSDNISVLRDFVSYYLLENDKDYRSSELFSDLDSVNLMTLHASKGLEFSQVFIVGMEEGIFPSQMSLLGEKQVEEERRLAYVGITRAMHSLTISYAENRFIYGKAIICKVSRFINELPKECISNVFFSN
ncbi:UvrD-helicase domain-containing protein [Blochmannia endosymbiont of Colobopsis nipponica]|uniref:UvrD-helicase domain-containing protein n=1 Tax=Blochmannia endosymbiont of Colobopsis nipponica TaxID=2681987 RepID=UPI001784F5BA|nr:UvrD-helicase domain-containing protein [Blochmannia endosymbiont of Colobopsis nipponica]QOI10886.1 UvrD-helicase domain-containing protein [Blochmannia endosymbiont of Colobopsis nipponica]QOI10896.1 UvrD-helicase domain-containing protein [Blochmannia endosymbiont of Colobopsis nipponica]